MAGLSAAFAVCMHDNVCAKHEQKVATHTCELRVFGGQPGLPFVRLPCVHVFGRDAGVRDVGAGDLLDGHTVLLRLLERLAPLLHELGDETRIAKALPYALVVRKRQLRRFDRSGDLSIPGVLEEGAGLIEADELPEGGVAACGARLVLHRQIDELLRAER